MIDPKELRIGNLIGLTEYDYIRDRKYRDGFEIVRVTQILTTGVSFVFAEENEKGLTYNDLFEAFEPITLTLEMLEKCGFEYDEVWEDSPPSWNKKGCPFYLDRDLQPMEAGFEMCGYKVEYLHLLQNLHFSLTGQELEINITE